jgi:NAD(P)-dependent dehydrogenase (short-subunit alcohol dehydrogenase family)
MYEVSTKFQNRRHIMNDIVCRRLHQFNRHLTGIRKMATNAPPFPTPIKTWHNKPYPAIDPTSYSLAGKSAIITGGAGIIGSAVARAMAAAHIEAIGLVGRTEAKLLEKKEELAKSFPETKFFTAAGDTTKKNSITAAFSKIREEVGKPLDILIANAGIVATKATVAEADVEGWWNGFEVNVLGALNSVQAFLPLAVENATIVNTSAGIAHMPHVPMPRSSYVASKLGAAKMFEYLQAETPALTVISVHPGVVPTMDEGNCIQFLVAKSTNVFIEDLSGRFMAWLCTSDAQFLKGKYVWANWDVEELKAMASELQSSPKFSTGLNGWP